MARGSTTNSFRTTRISKPQTKFMSAIYRSYEVLVEETARNHKTRGVGKTKKDFKPAL